MRAPWPLLAIAVIALLGRDARAHQSAVKSVDVTIDGARATVAFTIAPGDVTEPLGLPADATPGVDQVLVPAAAAYVAGWLAIAVPGGAGCPRGPATLRPSPDRRFVIVEWTATCGEPIERVELDFTAMFAIDRRHEALVAVHAPGQQVDPAIVRAGGPKLVARAGEAPSIAGWVRFGMDHIYEGPDHISFVLALLIVVVLARTADGWQRRSPLAALRATALIVTSFTVAHSLSLIAAALGYVALPSRLVESVIAASILYTAVEDMIRPDVRWRFALTFGFGLIHGLGFASQLEDQLPADRVIVPLVSFNLGVELGQLTVVAVALPLLWLAARYLGAGAYRRIALPVLAGLLCVIAIKWLLERAFDLRVSWIPGM